MSGAGTPWLTSLVRTAPGKLDVVGTTTRTLVGHLWRNRAGLWSGDYLDSGAFHCAGTRHAVLAAAWYEVERRAIAAAISEREA